jgi:phosphoribosylamine--glycine ligase
VSVVIASDGYPDSPRKGDVITLPHEIPAHALLFHAGTRLMPNQTVVTDGGRVLNAVAVGNTLQEARTKAYAVAQLASFNGAWSRSDIGAVKERVAI